MVFDSKDERNQAIVRRWEEIDADPKNTYLRSTPRFIKIAAEFGLSYPTVRQVILSAKKK